jgi:ATP-dependent Lon protease
MGYWCVSHKGHADVLAARIKRIAQSKTDPTEFILTLEGLARIRLPRSLPPVLQIIPSVPLYISTYSLPIPTLHSASALLSGSTRGGSGLWEPAAQLLPVQLHERMKEMPVGLLADVLSTVLGVEWELRVEMLGLVDVDERTEKVKAALWDLVKKRQGGGALVKSNEGEKPPEANTASSRALVRRNPATPPPAQPGQSGVPEDLQPIVTLSNTRKPELSGGAYNTITRELARLAKIPAQSAEYGVAKTYLELLLALPWKKVSEDEGVDLLEARRRLEEEHEGLEEVKRRVVEYLAVYRYVIVKHLRMSLTCTG